MLRIAIVLHEQSTRRRVPPWIAIAMAEPWRAMGHHVELVYGVGRAVRADLLVPNVDLTVMPQVYRDYFAGFEHVANRRVVDISKRSFSRLGVRPGDGYEGPVIVKTDLNSGGWPEREAFGRTWRERKWARWLFRTDPVTGFHPRLALDPARYPVFDSVNDLPRGVLANPRFHVERFVPERVGDLYGTRTYAFAGTYEYAARNTSPEPVIKAARIVERKEVGVPEELRAFRAERGFDFGKFDYAVVDGEVHLFDVNNTPTFAPSADAAERHAQLARSFARGLLNQFGLG